ncbi:MAG: tetratricopeptide repeat protein, partial [Vicinamibacterales bacterium]
VPYMGQIEVHAAEKNWVAARNAAARAVEVNPTYLPAYLVLVDSGIQARQFREAQADAQAIQRKWPKLAAGYSAEAQVLLAQNRVGDAERVLRDGLASVPDAALVTRLYTLLTTQNRAADAESFAGAWSDRHPKDVELMSSLGVMALTAKKLDVAEKWFRKAADAQPRNPATLNNLAWTLALRKNPESVGLAERALTIAPDNAAMLDTLGFVHLELGQPDRALAPLQRAVELVPGSPSARIHLARALVATGKPDEARKELAHVRQLDNAQSYRNEIDELEKGL